MKLPLVNCPTALSVIMIKRVIMAPMEGVLDPTMRQILTAINHYDYCVTEFIRVTDHKLPDKVFYRLSPELYRQGQTTSGTPVRLQLLGQVPELMAENALRAIELGSFGIDINAGCPAKTVVGHQGGAYLLQYPEQIYQITRQVRQAIGYQAPLSVKIRLGWQDKSRSLDIADAVAQGGANEIVVHGRTKADGYQADKIDWAAIGQLRSHLTIPVVANGEIFTPSDAVTCQKQSGCEAIMLGRGAFNLPNLANMIRYQSTALSWPEIVTLLLTYARSELNHDRPVYHSSRIKQWLQYLKLNYPQAQLLLTQIRMLKTQTDMIAALSRYA